MSCFAHVIPALVVGWHGIYERKELGVRSWEWRRDALRLGVVFPFRRCVSMSKNEGVVGWGLATLLVVGSEYVLMVLSDEARQGTASTKGGMPSRVRAARENI